MTAKKITMVPIERHFDADGKPNCRGCWLAVYYDSQCGYPPTMYCSAIDGELWSGEDFNAEYPKSVTPRPSCPVHTPTKEPL